MGSIPAAWKRSTITLFLLHPGPGTSRQGQNKARKKRIRSSSKHDFIHTLLEESYFYSWITSCHIHTQSRTHSLVFHFAPLWLLWVNPSGQNQSLDVRNQMLVFSDSENNCMQGSFLKRMHAKVFWGKMHATRNAILTDARNGLLGNGFAQGMGQIPNSRHLHFMLWWTRCWIKI